MIGKVVSSVPSTGSNLNITDKRYGLFCDVTGGKNTKPVSIRNAPDMYVYVDEVVYQTIAYIVENVNQEVGWYTGSEVTFHDGKIQVSILPAYPNKPVIIPKQEVHATTAEISPDWYKTEWPDLEGDELIAVMNKHASCWGHSHVNMGVTPSYQDISTLDYLAENNTNNYYVAMIVNKKGEMRFDVVLNNDGLLIKYEDVKWALETYGMDDTIIDSTQAALKTNVSRVTPVAYGYGNITPTASNKSKKNSPTLVMPNTLTTFKDLNKMTEEEITAELEYYDSKPTSAFVWKNEKYTQRYNQLIYSIYS